jgi:hypothetical protein
MTRAVFALQPALNPAPNLAAASLAGSGVTSR